jgi:hypothetical protein
MHRNLLLQTWPCRSQRGSESKRRCLFLKRKYRQGRRLVEWLRVAHQQSSMSPLGSLCNWCWCWCWCIYQLHKLNNQGRHLHPRRFLVGKYRLQYMLCKLCFLEYWSGPSSNCNSLGQSYSERTQWDTGWFRRHHSQQRSRSRGLGWVLRCMNLGLKQGTLFGQPDWLPSPSHNSSRPS